MDATVKAEYDQRKDLLRVDKNHLEEASGSNPPLIYQWCLELAQARSNLKRAKNKTKLTKAQVGKDVRNNPGGYDIIKVTDNSVEEAIVADTRYVQAQEEEVEAEFDADRLEAFVEALRDRRQAITDDVKLFGMMYFRKSDTSGQPTEQERVAQSPPVVIPPRRPQQPKK